MIKKKKLERGKCPKKRIDADQNQVRGTADPAYNQRGRKKSLTKEKECKVPTKG